MKMLAAATALFGLAAGGLARQDAGQPLKVSVVRFYQPATSTTTIEGVLEIRLDSLLKGGAHVTQYRVDVAVSDSSGLQLQHSSWTRGIPGTTATGHSITSVESFGFNAAPGRYQVRVKVVPSEGDSLERAVDVEAYRSRPAISDLLLANRVRQPDTDSEPPQQGEIRRAGLMLRTAVPPRLQPTSGTLSYYAELYPQAAISGAQLVAEVIGANGQRVIATPPRTVSFAAGGGLTRGSLDLSGLPPGMYTLRLSVRQGDSSIVAEAPFAMGSLEDVAAAAGSVRAAPAAGGDVFATVTEDQLDSLEAPLVYVARNPGELGMYRNLTVEGKRRFLRDFWSSPRMRIANTVERPDFYRLVALANRYFHESGTAQIAGWNTDRGRVFIRNGMWDERLQRPASQPMSYDAWKYTSGRFRYYIFGDRTGLGNFVLLATNDLHEQGLYQSSWPSMLGADATRDISQFLGLNLNNNN